MPERWSSEDEKGLLGANWLESLHTVDLMYSRAWAEIIDCPIEVARHEATLKFRLPKLKPIYVTSFKLVFTLLLLGLLVRIVGWRSLIDALGATQGSWLAANYAAALMTFGLMAFTLRWLLLKVGLRSPSPCAAGELHGQLLQSPPTR